MTSLVPSPAAKQRLLAVMEAGKLYTRLAIVATSPFSRAYTNSAMRGLVDDNLVHVDSWAYIKPKNTSGRFMPMYILGGGESAVEPCLLGTRFFKVAENAWKLEKNAKRENSREIKAARDKARAADINYEAYEEKPNSRWAKQYVEKGVIRVTLNRNYVAKEDKQLQESRQKKGAPALLGYASPLATIF